MGGATGPGAFVRLLAACFQQPAAFRLPRRAQTALPHSPGSKFATDRVNGATDQSGAPRALPRRPPEPRISRADRVEAAGAWSGPPCDPDPNGCA